MRASRPVRGQRRLLKISTRIRKALWSSSLRKPGPPCTVAHEAHPCTTSGLSSPTQTAITRAGVLRRGFLPLGDTFTSTRPDEAMFTVGDVVPGPSICLVLVRPAVAVLCTAAARCRRRTTQVRPHAFGISCNRPPTGSTVEAAAAWCLVNRRKYGPTWTTGTRRSLLANSGCSAGSPTSARKVSCKTTATRLQRHRCKAADAVVLQSQRLSTGLRAPLHRLGGTS